MPREMMKLFSPRAHGLVDYALAFAFLLLPGTLAFSQSASKVAFAVGILYLGISLVTRYPLGVFKTMPFTLHGVLESAMAAAWIASPWLFGFAADSSARNFFMAAGVGLLAVAALTDYTGEGAEEEEGAPHPFERRQSTDRRYHDVAVAEDRRMRVSDRRRHYPAAA